jgi:hypothetical protein
VPRQRNIKRCEKSAVTKQDAKSFKKHTWMEQIVSASGPAIVSSGTSGDVSVGDKIEASSGPSVGAFTVKVVDSSLPKPAPPDTRVAPSSVTL